MRGRKRSTGVAAVALMAIVVAGCTTSELDPDAPVAVSGIVRAPEGAPAADVPVVLTRNMSAADVFGGLGIGMASLGTVCAAQPPPRICTDGVRRVETDGGGRFSFDMKGRDTQDSLGFANGFVLEAALPAASGELAGPSTVLELMIQREQLGLPDVRTWRPQMDLATGGGKVQLTWTAPGPDLGTTGGAEVVYDSGSAGPVWLQRAPGTDVAFDARLLEGARGGVTVTLGAEGVAEGTDVDLTYRSPSLPYASAAEAPVTRGSSCTAVGLDGAATALSPCPLTDGSFAPAGEALVAAESVVIEAPSGFEAALVAVRGCEPPCRVEASSDGAGYVGLFETTDSYAAFAPQPRPAIRFLRITGSNLEQLTEVSAWQGEPPESGLLADVAPADVAAPGRSAFVGGDGDDDEFPWLAVVAGGLILLVVAGGAFALGRRRAA